MGTNIFKVRGAIFVQQGDLGDAINSFNQSLKAATLSQLYQIISISHNNLGYVYIQTGNFQEAKDHFLQSLNNAQKITNDTFVYYPLSNMGIYYYNIGNISEAKKYHDEALKIALKLNHESNIASQYRDLALISKSQGDAASAFVLLKKSLKLRILVGNQQFIAYTLSYLIEITDMLGNKEMFSQFIKQLENLCIDSENELILGICKYNQAFKHKISNKLAQKVEAMKLYQELIKNNHIDTDTRINSILHLCDLLIFELQVTGSQDVMDEIENLTAKLLYHAQNAKSLTMLIKTKILQARLRMIQSQIREGFRILDEAKEIARKNNLNDIIITIDTLIDQFLLEKSIWNKEIENDQELQKRVIKSQISDYINAVLKVKDNVIQK